MNLVALKYIVSLAREKHFGHAAQACGVTQPTLSVAVKNVETELGIQLFERTPMCVKPTVAGLSVVRHAIAILQEVRAIGDVVCKFQDPAIGVLRLGLVYNLHPRWVPHLMQHSRLKTPQIPLLWHQDTHSKLQEKLNDGSIDCAIIDVPITDAGLKIHTLIHEPLYIAVSAQHPLATDKTLNLNALENETLLMSELGDGQLESLGQTCPDFAQWINDRRSIVQKVKDASLESIAHMVVAGMGIAILPRLSTCGKDADISYLKLKSTNLARQFVFAWRDNNPRESSCLMLLQTLQALVQTEWAESPDFNLSNDRKPS